MATRIVGMMPSLDGYVDEYRLYFRPPDPRAGYAVLGC
jgi:hypothetical protein